MVLVDAGVVATYFAVSLALGALFKSKADTIRGFLVANREIGDWLLAFTFGATYFSSVVIVVGGSWAYMWGDISLVVPLANVALGVLVTFILVGSRVARLSNRFDALTVPELFYKVYGVRSMRLLLAGVTSLGLLFYAATVLAGAAVTLSTILRMDIVTSALIVATVVAVYVALGGMYSVVWTDALQGVVMASGIAALLALAFARTGGGFVAGTAPLKPVSPLLIADLALLTSIAVWGLPQLLNRFYTVPSQRVVCRATGLAAVFAFIVSYGAFLAGFAARSIVPGVPPLKAVPELARVLMGATGSAVFLAAVLAASMSTADSVALTIASSVVYDIVGSRRTIMLRLASLLAVLAALGISLASLLAPKDVAMAVTTVFKTGWSMVAGAYLVPVLALIAGSKRRLAMMASSIAGSATALAYGLCRALGRPLPLTELSFSMTILVSALAYVLVALAERGVAGEGLPRGAR